MLPGGPQEHHAQHGAHGRERCYRPGERGQDGLSFGFQEPFEVGMPAVGGGISTIAEWRYILPPLRQ